MNVNLDDYKILFVIVSASTQSVIMCSNYAGNTSYNGAGSSFTAYGVQDCRISLVKTDTNKWRIDGSGFNSVISIYGFK